MTNIKFQKIVGNWWNFSHSVSSIAWTWVNYTVLWNFLCKMGFDDRRKFSTQTKTWTHLYRQENEQNVCSKRYHSVFGTHSDSNFHQLDYIYVNSIWSDKNGGKKTPEHFELKMNLMKAFLCVSLYLHLWESKCLRAHIPCRSFCNVHFEFWWLCTRVYFIFGNMWYSWDHNIRHDLWKFVRCHRYVEICAVNFYYVSYTDNFNQSCTRLWSKQRHSLMWNDIKQQRVKKLADSEIVAVIHVHGISSELGRSLFCYGKCTNKPNLYRSIDFLCIVGLVFFLLYILKSMKMRL